MAGVVYTEPVDFRPMVRGLALVSGNFNRSMEHHMPKQPDPDQFQITLNRDQIDEIRILCANAAIILMNQKASGILNRRGATKCAGLCDLTTMLREMMLVQAGGAK